MAGIGDSKGFSCSRCCSPWRYYEPADLFGAGAAWGLKENLPARQGFGEYGTCHETLLVAGPALLLPVCDSCLKDTCCLQAQPIGTPVQRCHKAERGHAGRGRTGSSKASSASLLQRLLRRSCVLPPPAWKGERPGRPAPLLRRAAGRCCRRRSPRATPRSAEDLCSTHASFTTTQLAN